SRSPAPPHLLYPPFPARDLAPELRGLINLAFPTPLPEL
ncbi:hypothetical protein AVEN_259234-1, partial [Araneus ventricosus]